MLKVPPFTPQALTFGVQEFSEAKVLLCQVKCILQIVVCIGFLQFVKVYQVRPGQNNRPQQKLWLENTSWDHWDTITPDVLKSSLSRVKTTTLINHHTMKPDCWTHTSKFIKGNEGNGQTCLFFGWIIYIFAYTFLTCRNFHHGAVSTSVDRRIKSHTDLLKKTVSILLQY